jgi:uracil-DNA glycosylase family 4
VTTQEKIIELEKIAGEVKNFKGLDIAKKCTQAVPGEGNPDSEIMFIGEAPGFNEDREGRPFVGRAGKLLEKSLQEILNYDRAQVYITNIVKYRPPENRDPFPEEIEACSDWLDRQITAINPKIICTLGRFSMAKFIPDVSISRVHGQSRFVELKGKRLILFPMYHPAAALRSISMLNSFNEDFIKLKNLLTPKSGAKQIIDPPVLLQPSLFN